MKKKVLKFQDFLNEELSKKQQKTVRGGDGEPKDPGKSGGNGNNTEVETQNIDLNNI